MNYDDDERSRQRELPPLENKKKSIFLQHCAAILSMAELLFKQCEQELTRLMWLAFRRYGKVIQDSWSTARPLRTWVGISYYLTSCIECIYSSCVDNALLLVCFWPCLSRITKQTCEWIFIIFYHWPAVIGTTNSYLWAKVVKLTS